MKKSVQYHFLLITLFCVPSIFAQDYDYMSRIAEQSCECVSEVEDTKNQEKFNLALGLCIIEASTPFKNELKRDYKIDLDKINQDGTKLGELIGLKMAGICPDEILRVAENSNVDEYDESASYISGIITKIDNEQFVVFSIKDDAGKTTKFYWLWYIESEMDLPTEYLTLIGKEVELYYYENDIYDPRIDEYKTFFIIEEMNLVK